MQLLFSSYIRDILKKFIRIYLLNNMLFRELNPFRSFRRLPPHFFACAIHLKGMVLARACMVRPHHGVWYHSFWIEYIMGDNAIQQPMAEMNNVMLAALMTVGC